MDILTAEPLSSDVKEVAEEDMINNLKDTLGPEAEIEAITVEEEEVEIQDDSRRRLQEAGPIRTRFKTRGRSPKTRRSAIDETQSVWASKKEATYRKIKAMLDACKDKEGYAKKMCVNPSKYPATTTTTTTTTTEVPGLGNAWNTGYTLVYEDVECVGGPEVTVVHNGDPDLLAVQRQTGLEPLQICIDACNEDATCTHLDLGFDVGNNENTVLNCYVNAIPSGSVAGGTGGPYTCLKKP